jgi:RNA polymerase sigma-70 factor (ECF subfamily)
VALASGCPNPLEEREMETAADDGRPPAGWLTELFARLREPLWLYVRRRVGGDGETASDIVQEAFLKLCQEPWPDIEPYATAWLYRTCRNRAIDAYRREEHMSIARNSHPGNADVSTLADQLLVPPGEALDRQERLAAVESELGKLSDQQQEILRLRLQCGLSYKQIAEVTELTVTNVGYHLHQAIVTLRERLGCR